MIIAASNRRYHQLVRADTRQCRAVAIAISMWTGLGVTGPCLCLVMGVCRRFGYLDRRIRLAQTCHIAHYKCGN